METTKILARIIGPVMIIPAIGIFLNFNTYQGMIGEFSKSPVPMLFGRIYGASYGPHHIAVSQQMGGWLAGSHNDSGLDHSYKRRGAHYLPGGFLVCDRSHDPNRFFRNILRCRSFSDYQGILGIV